MKKNQDKREKRDLRVEKEMADGSFKGTHSTKIWQDIYK